MNVIQRTSLTALVVLSAGSAVAAGTLDSAQVTRVFNVVELLPPDAGAKAASVGDAVGGQTAVQTGSKSRAELQFNDATLARLGANSVFTFEQGTRDLDLKEGVILLQVPKDAGGARVNTAAVSAAVTGTTVMVEFRRAVQGARAVVKFIVLEGTMRLFLKGRVGESVLLKAGQMANVEPDAKTLPEPVTVDLERLTATSGLMSSEFTPLRNEPYIVNAVKQQQSLIANGKLNVKATVAGKKRSPILASAQANTLASIRTDALVSEGEPSRQRPANRVVQRTVTPRKNNDPPQPPPPRPPKPPKPPKCDPPKPPNRPVPKPPAPPPQPPPVPPAPEQPVPTLPDNR